MLNFRAVVGKIIRKRLWSLLGIPTHYDLRVSPLVRVDHPINVHRGTGGCIGQGSFLQGPGQINIGDDVWIGPNVGIITSNHDLLDLSRDTSPQDVKIDDHCWIGMNAVILPGVHLGPHTVVGAGAVVTRSFPDGHCVMVGNPSKAIR